jgi:hypothetical protein
MNASLIRRKYKQLVNYLYSPKAYYRRVMTFWSIYPPLKRNAHLDIASAFEYSLAFLHSFLRLVILGRERPENWK